MTTTTTEFTTVETTDGIQLTEAQVADALELASLRRTIKIAEEREKALRDGILDIMGEATVGTDAGGHPVVNITHSIRRGVSLKRLEAVYPDAFDKVGTVTESAQVRIKVPVAPDPS